jgi:hypothetical protein
MVVGVVKKGLLMPGGSHWCPESVVTDRVANTQVLKANTR